MRNDARLAIFLPASNPLWHQSPYNKFSRRAHVLFLPWAHQELVLFSSLLVQKGFLCRWNDALVFSVHAAAALINLRSVRVTSVGLLFSHDSRSHGEIKTPRRGLTPHCHACLNAKLLQNYGGGANLLFKRPQQSVQKRKVLALNNQRMQLINQVLYKIN